MLKPDRVFFALGLIGQEMGVLDCRLLQFSAPVGLEVVVEPPSARGKPSTTSAPSLTRSNRMAWPGGDTLLRPTRYVPSGDHARPGLKAALPNSRRPVPFALITTATPSRSPNIPLAGAVYYGIAPAGATVWQQPRGLVAGATYRVRVMQTVGLDVVVGSGEMVFTR